MLSLDILLTVAASVLLLFGSYAVLFSAWLPLSGIKVNRKSLELGVNTHLSSLLSSWTYLLKTPTTNTWFYSASLLQPISSLQTGLDGNTIKTHRITLEIRIHYMGLKTAERHISESRFRTFTRFWSRRGRFNLGKTINRDPAGLTLNLTFY